MATLIYSTIDIASHELSLKIYGFSRHHGIQELNHVRHKLPISSEIYSDGVISYQTIEEICHVLNDFKRILAEWDARNWQIYATGTLRDAGNALVVIDQIKIQTGFNVKILSNSETRFLYYKALALRDPNFHTMIREGTLIVDIGGGSVQLSIFNEGKLCATQNLLLGASRIRELLQVMEGEAYDFHALIDEYIEKDLFIFKKLYLNSISISHIIAVGEMIPEIYYYFKNEKSDFNGKLPHKVLHRGYLPRSANPQITGLTTPTLLLCRKISEMTGCEEITLSQIDLCDSMMAEYAEKKFRLRSSHDFTEDILSSSRNIILHSCGAYISEIQSRECSYRIIMSTEIIGISHKERTLIANMVRYNSSAFPRYEELDEDFSREEYITIVKLNAILKTANVLDKSNRHKIKNVGVTLQDGILTITADTMEDITLEKGLFHQKADVFQDVFGIRPMLKQKRSGGKNE